MFEFVVLSSKDLDLCLQIGFLLVELGVLLGDCLHAVGDLHVVPERFIFPEGILKLGLGEGEFGTTLLTLGFQFVDSGFEAECNLPCEDVLRVQGQEKIGLGHSRF